MKPNQHFNEIYTLKGTDIAGNEIGLTTAIGAVEDKRGITLDKMLGTFDYEGGVEIGFYSSGYKLEFVELELNEEELEVFKKHIESINYVSKETHYLI